MTKTLYKTMLTKNLFRRSEINGLTKFLQVQQDNAGPHVSGFDADIIKAGEQGGWTIELESQPPRSPDLNVMDLVVFNALQALQLKTITINLNGLIFAVQKAFRDINPATIDKCFITLHMKDGTTTSYHEFGRTTLSD
ncbi:hypothetical protein PHMEG_00028984 [Phytophthora megakarya]|uniref:Uncharacterized protein n=1 Tax=Phytophthora megakarya TaxID=4795 RepID=A0A225V348_9STRA|nr:hypothetical protein PHMEG_00028984 [Phytophthora megakarya]